MTVSLSFHPKTILAEILVHHCFVTIELSLLDNYSSKIGYTDLMSLERQAPLCLCNWGLSIIDCVQHHTHLYSSLAFPYLTQFSSWTWRGCFREPNHDKSACETRAQRTAKVIFLWIIAKTMLRHKAKPPVVPFHMDQQLTNRNGKMLTRACRNVLASDLSTCCNKFVFCKRRLTERNSMFC